MPIAMPSRGLRGPDANFVKGGLQARGGHQVGRAWFGRHPPGAVTEVIRCQEARADGSAF